ncbi:MAG: methyltransferase domain-containing protein, partial [Chthoniobacterales bacterium]
PEQSPPGPARTTGDRPSGDPLSWTGERLVTTCKRPLAYEHLHRYSVAYALAGGKRVLDIACGEGYGANLLADVAADVVGVDIDPGAIEHAQRSYRRANLRFIKGDCTAIPLPDKSIDLVASFETIEHLTEQEAFLAEIKRVLAKDGILVISSPDKAEYERISQAANPFHKVELAHQEFATLVREHFQHCVFGRQRLVVGSWIASDGPERNVASSTFHGGFDGIARENGVQRGLYSIAVCSDAKLPLIQFGLFEDFEESAQTWDLLDRFDSAAKLLSRISKLTSDAEQKRRQLQKLEQENEQRLQQLREEGAAKSCQIVHLQRQSERRSQRIAVLRRWRDRQLLEVAALRKQLEESAEKATRETKDLIDARWEVLSLRAESIRGNQAAAGAMSRLLEMENHANSATSERDQLRRMVTDLQQDLEQERLNVSAMRHQMRLAQERAEGDATRLKEMHGQLQAAHDRLRRSEESSRMADNRTAAALDELQTVHAQARDAQEALHRTGKELAARRKQISLLHERLQRRLILPFGKVQSQLDELTKPPS